jgi:amidase
VPALDASHDVRTLARKMANREVTATDAVTACLQRLRSVDEVTNCVAAWNDDDAIDRAAALDRTLARDGPVGPLHGLPITVKDWIDVAGLPCTGGYEQCRDRVPEADATVVARMRAAGAIVLAKTTVFEDSAIFGPVRNPRDPTRSPGGSSSGSAAAVAGGGCPLALGSDSGGSIRIPAAWCGAPGLKPSAGLVPTTGHFPRVGERGDGRTVIGPIGARVRTLADVLAVIAGPDDRDAGCPPVALGAVDDVEVAVLRIGWSLGDERWTASAATCDAVQAAVARLATMGATIIGEVPQYLDEALDVTKRYWARCHGELPGSDAEQHLVDWDRYRVRMLRATDGVDAVVMPATPSVAPVHGQTTEAGGIFTLPASLTGAPGVVVPVAEDAGLPIAVQIVARRWRDDVALRIAEALES